MKRSTISAEQSATAQFAPRVAKLEKNKYAAYVDMHVGPLWEMALQGLPVRICRKRKSAKKAALALLSEARRLVRQQG